MSEKYKAQNALLKEVDVLNLELKKENEELLEKYQKEQRRNDSLEIEIYLLREQLKQREKSGERRDGSHSRSNNKRRRNHDMDRTPSNEKHLQKSES